ncbi:hypothetical protein [Halobacillus sp. Marseille-P3879]|uniref:hypothetical protein n=1 Tax=Halobacillus sp. Marseille-P3879 TaxID=2045014 RepID=UPI000C7DD775|nr:hypothetical protein [Halobacillus sp. Marseille-P3879]
MKIIELIDKAYLVVILGAVVTYFAGLLNGEYLFAVVRGSFVIRAIRKFVENEMTLAYGYTVLSDLV